MLSDEIAILASRGRSSFGFEELSRQVASSSPEALKAALHRLHRKGELAMPLRGFYVIVPPEFRSLGCLPAEQFIPDLMGHLKEDYYAALLTAAAYHGAAHQRPQVFQVVVRKPRRPIKCGKVAIDFVVRKNLAKVPTQDRNTRAGIIKLSTPEATAYDLIGYAKECGGLDNVATVLMELAERLNAEKLVAMAALSPISWSQRLGYLLESVGAGDVGEKLVDYIAQHKPVRTPLLPASSIKSAKTSKRWRIFINSDVEPDL